MDEIRRLPLEERIELVGDVWDTIAASPEDVPTPQWHLRELEKRLAKADPRYLSWDEVKERLQGGS